MLYHILNQHAKKWWYNVDLRSRGKVQEARERKG